MPNLNSLLKLSTVKRFAAGAVILQEGVTGDPEMLIILQGTADLYRKYNTPAQQFVEMVGPGGFAGEQALFLNAPPTETAVAQSNLIAVSVTRQNAEEFFATAPDITFSIMEGILKKQCALQKEHEALIADVRAGVATRKLREAESKASRSSVLFPEGHGSYHLPIDNSLEEYFYLDTVKCPVCGHSFQNLMIITSRLRREASDTDLRVHYKDVEPMYYEIITCPKCLLSAAVDQFKSIPRRLASRLDDELARFRNVVAVKEGYERDTFTIFAGYYLALLCAPICFDDHQLVQAVLWQKLSRLYSDLGDTAMYAYATKECLRTYTYAYEHFHLSEKKVQQVCYLIGDLHQRQGELNQARNYFFLAKSNKSGTAVMKRQADIRLDEIRELIQKEKAIKETLEENETTPDN